MDIKEISIEDLKPAEYNPRKLTGKEYKQLRDSLEGFGMVDPLIVNSAVGRENLVIGGHQRLIIWKEMGNITIPCVFVNIPELERERELNLRLNKNLGEWDYEKLANFSEEEMLKVGFELSEIQSIFDAEPEIEGEISFSPELMEEQNYVVLYFDNELDWNVAQEKLHIKTAKDIKGLNKGVGRVINGKEVIARLQ